jgi:glycosyltransferase involved in cell wall biosynthesis
VIGEDCSTDGTRDIVFGYQKKRPDVIRVVTSDTNVGMKRNGYRTTRACRGKYVAFCEGDDYWHRPEKLQKQVDYLENHTECGLVFSSYDVHHVKSGKRINDFINHRRWEIPKCVGVFDLLDARDRRGIILTCTVMLRRDLLMQVVESDPYLHQSTHFLMGDTQLWVEMITLAQAHFIPESLATHTLTEESATRSGDRIKLLRFEVSSNELSLHLCNKYNLPSHIKDAFEAAWCECTLLAFHTRNSELADGVRRRKNVLNWKEWLRFHGAKNSLVNHMCRAAVFIPDLFRDRNERWL